MLVDVLTDSAEGERRTRGEEAPAAGYYLVAQVALTVEELAQQTAHYRDSTYRLQGAVAVVEVPIIDEGDSTVWEGSFDVLGAAANLARSSAFRDGLAEVDSLRWRLIRIRRRPHASGYFVRRSNGSVQYALTEHYVGDPFLTVRAERVSLEYLSDPPRPSLFPPIP